MRTLLIICVLLVATWWLVRPRIGGHGQARSTAAASQIDSFSTALEAFKVDNGYYPRGKNGLQDLVQQPSDAPNWRQQYMKEVPLDPWGDAYLYESPGRNNVNGYDLSSPGPDGKAGSEDDITNWSRN
jgi:general secretion pathway protein G